MVIEPGRYVSAGKMALRMARGKVVGRLVRESGESAPEVDVVLSPMRDMARTDRDGIFQFIAVNRGDHVLRITDDRFFTYNRNFSMGSGEQLNLGNIQVFRRATGAKGPRTTPVLRLQGASSFDPESRR